MESNNMVNFKVFLRDEATSEARRFTVDTSVVTSFIFMKEKLQTVFPALREADFKITWKDADGDEITIASDEDLITAFTEMSGSVKVLYVIVTQRSREPEFFIDAEVQDASFRGPHIVCDVCNQTITGFRYKCLQCPDYDLCASCEHQGHHSEHLMMRVPNNDVYMPKCGRKFMHHMSRNLKKSAHHASKEAYRAAKFASRFAPFKPAGEDGKTEHRQPQAGASTQNPEGPQGCPFSGGESVNMTDVHALGAMARQHLGPLLEAFQAPPSTPAAPTAPSAPSSNINPEQGVLIMDMIRNAVDGFFGRIPEANSTPEQSEQQNEKQPMGKNDQQATAMDVEGAPLDAPIVTPPGNIDASAQKPDAPGNIDASTQKLDAQRRDPGWTFVVTNPAQPNADTNTNTQNGQPVVPPFVYHENRKVAEGLIQLYEMGFSNEGGYLTRLLERYDGNVTAVVKAIVDQNN